MDAKDIISQDLLARFQAVGEYLSHFNADKPKDGLLEKVTTSLANHRFFEEFGKLKESFLAASKHLSGRQFNLLKNKQNHLEEQIGAIFFNSQETLEPESDKLNEYFAEATQKHHDLREFIVSYLDKIYKEDFLVRGYTFKIKDYIDYEAIYLRRDILREMIISSPNLSSKEQNQLASLISRPFSKNHYTEAQVEKAGQKILEEIQLEDVGAQLFAEEIQKTIMCLRLRYESKEYIEAENDDFHEIKRL